MDLSSWLFGEIDRERLLDMDRRLRPVRRNTLGVLAAALMISAPWTGWWTLAPLLVAAGLFALAASRAPQGSHPEYAIFGAWVMAEAMIAGSVALTGVTIGAVSWLAIPVVTLPARFSTRVVAVGVMIALSLALAVGFGTDAQALLHNPPLILVPTALILATAMLSVALMRSDIEHRDECVIDQLTGLLNRKALATRSEELAQQSAVSGEPIGIIVGDLDRFKTINDSVGHAAGDAVLVDVAYRMRVHLRAFDLAYRIGGEEFVVMMPGADLRQTAALAENLRAAVLTETDAGGQRVTMSCGVSASVRGEPFRYGEVFAAADSALYEAKRTGRDRVCVAATRGLGSSALASVGLSSIRRSHAIAKTSRG
jgi:diguanylate cyclase (GGDEF)-like protein